jgi:hypothetical protein
MSFHRSVLVACTAVFAAAFGSTAFAQCGGCGGAVTYAQPVVEVQPVVVQPVVQVQPIQVQPVVEVQPIVVQPVVQAVPVAPAPIAVDHWDTNGFGCGGGCGGCGGGCGCGGCGGGCGGCSSTFGYHTVAAPMYVVNQGPEYSGPGLTVPFGTYSPATNLAAPAQYPYVAGPGYSYGPRYPYYRSRYAYHRPYWNPYRSYPHHYWRG